MNQSDRSSAVGYLPVAVDAMGGDHGPEVVVEGALQAAKSFGISSILVGDQGILQSRLSALGYRPGASPSSAPVEVKHAPEVVTMEDSPSVAIRGKPNCSIRIAYDLVKSGKASGVVSPGNTGAVMAAGLYVSGALPGISRPAIASLIPNVGTTNPTVLLDAGANVDCRASQLVEFALMGHYYAKVVLGCESPRVALISNGSERSKGNDVTRAAATMLGELREIQYVGYVEGRDLGRNAADVVVCDGFVGNVLLKTMEGSVELVFDLIRQYAERNLRGSLGMWLARPVLKLLFREKLDPAAYGGAPLLGLQDVAIICHGSANSRAISNAIRVARKFSEGNFISQLSSVLTGLDLKESGSFNDAIWDRMSQRFEKQGSSEKSRGSVGGKGVAAAQNIDEE